MRRLNYIICFLLFFSSLYAEKKIENIKIFGKGYYNFNIYLSEFENYEIKVNETENLIKLYFKDFEISNKFPGSSFHIESSTVDKMFLTRYNDQGIIINFSVDPTSKYIIKNFERSNIISVFIYKDQVLDEDDKLFISALQHEVEGDKEKALFEYRKLLARNPNHSDALFHAGLLRRMLGYNYQSKANLNLSRTNGNTNPEISLVLSEVYLLLGDKVESDEELAKFAEQLANDKKSSFDFSVASISSNDINDLTIDNEFGVTVVIPDFDSSAIIATQVPDSKVIKTIPVNSSSYYYSLATNILLVVVVIGSIVYIFKMIRRRKRQVEDKRKKIKIDLKEKPNVYPNIYPGPAFEKLVKTYNREIETVQKNLDPNNQLTQVDKFIKSVPNDENKQLKIEANTESDIDRLARKYQVERGKIELAMKILAKNETESPKDKYILFMRMLKDNMSLEELASSLRIPKGELELVMNLKNM